jgi:undecaprenyl-diphosphatase
MPLAAALTCSFLFAVALAGTPADGGQAGTTSVAAVEMSATADPEAVRDSADSGKREERTGAGRQFGRQVILPLAGDQRMIWTAPFHLNRRQARFWAPAAAGAAALVLADQRLYRETTGRLSPATRNSMGKFSRLGNPAYMVGVSGGLWLLGSSGSRRPLRQTALLASRALIDDMLVVGVLKVALGRQRPPGDSFGGLRDGIRSGDYRSLPSGHASAVWTMASVISSRHRQRWVPFVLYGFAGAVSITRVTSGRHFYGDVAPGALIGYSIGKMVVRRSQANP